MGRTTHVVRYECTHSQLSLLIVGCTISGKDFSADALRRNILNYVLGRLSRLVVTPPMRLTTALLFSNIAARRNSAGALTTAIFFSIIGVYMFNTPLTRSESTRAVRSHIGTCFSVCAPMIWGVWEMETPNPLEPQTPPCTSFK